MLMYEIKFEDGTSLVRFAKCKADMWHRFPKAWTINEVIIK